MTTHEIDLRAVERARTIAEMSVVSCGFPPKPAKVRTSALQYLHAALVLAWPEMDEEEVSVLMLVDDAEEFAPLSDRQFPIWWSNDVVGRLADILNPDRVPSKPRREPKPVPAHLLATPGLPLCGPKRRDRIEVVRRPMPVREVRPTRVATPWNPPEAQGPRRTTVQRPLPHWVLGDPAPGRSALDERRMALAETTS